MLYLVDGNIFFVELNATSASAAVAKLHKRNLVKIENVTDAFGSEVFLNTATIISASVVEISNNKSTNERISNV
jgi:hypothetical protein